MKLTIYTYVCIYMEVFQGYHVSSGEMGQFLSSLFYRSNLFLYYYYNDVGIKCLQSGLNFIYLFTALV